jgi:peptidoglycan/LPS O-acetylase OafA/YrhL
MALRSMVQQKHDNNFDLIRVIAATQVFIAHVFPAFGYNGQLIKFIDTFPGVPVFYFISGYLIACSYENIGIKGKKLIFYKKRVLRIFPGLYFATFFSISLLVISGYLTHVSFTWNNLLIFLAAQLTFFQFYTPDFLRNYGVGSFNGITWTLFVELQFYILYPYLQRFRDSYLIILLVISLLINMLSMHLNDGSIYFKLLNLSLMPWLYMFLTGILLYRKNYLLQKMVSKGAKLVPLLLVLYFILYHYFTLIGLGGGNKLNPICFFILVYIVSIFAFYRKCSFTDVDLTYGIYLYHMSFINFFIYKNMFDTAITFLIIIIFTLFLSYLSYIFIESRFMNLHPKI